MLSALTATSLLALVLVVILYGAYRKIGVLRRDNERLTENLAAAQEELAQLDERVKRRTGELDQAYKELVEVDLKDRLTGLANRRHFDDMLATEFTRLKRSGQPLSLIVMSVDHFQNYNDVHGTPAAEALVQRIGATLIERMKRTSDMAVRLGGGEFALLLPDTDFAGGKTVAEQARRLIEGLGVPHNASTASKVVTVSVGLATVTTTHMGAASDVLQLATNAMQRSREAGGNRVAGSQRLRPTTLS